MASPSCLGALVDLEETLHSKILPEIEKTLAVPKISAWRATASR